MSKAKTSKSTKLSKVFLDEVKNHYDMIRVNKDAITNLVKDLPGCEDFDKRIERECEFLDDTIKNLEEDDEDIEDNEKPINSNR